MSELKPQNPLFDSADQCRIFPLRLNFHQFSTMGSYSEITPSIAPNNLLTLSSKDTICTAFGIKISSDASIIHIAKAAGYDSLFIDLEHTALTVKDANQLCIVANSAGITPFVRVPHQCGDGFIQKILDNGAMGVIVPHIHGIGKHTSNGYSLPTC